MHSFSQKDTPFPLKRYYMIYGGIGSIIFYVLLFTLFIQAERQALYEEYIHGVSEKARSMYQDIQRDFLIPREIGIEQVSNGNPALTQALRHEIDAIVDTDFSLVKLKLLTADGRILYDHESPEKDGTRYGSADEPGFVSALQGKPSHVIEVEEDGRRLMEAYLPIRGVNRENVVAVLEIYDDVSRFEFQVKKALKNALFFPTLIFIVFNVVLCLIVAKADRIIAEKTNLLVTIRKNMEKYISRSAVAAIYQAVSQNKNLFLGNRRTIVIFFSDIRGFTAYSEGTEPENVVQTLNELFQLQTEIIQKHGGIIDKFVGDEIMVVFEEGQESAAVEAGRDILATLEAHSWLDLKIGIGIHSGEAVVGSIGAKDRRDYTAIGDTVNIGARLCGACPKGSIFISADVYQKLSTDLQSVFQARDAIGLKGKTAPIPIYVFSPADSR